MKWDSITKEAKNFSREPELSPFTKDPDRVVKALTLNQLLRKQPGSMNTKKNSSTIPNLWINPTITILQSQK
jgi:hypothetical protein